MPSWPYKAKHNFVNNVINRWKKKKKRKKEKKQSIVFCLGVEVCLCVCKCGVVERSMNKDERVKMHQDTTGVTPHTDPIFPTILCNICMCC